MMIINSYLKLLGENKLLSPLKSGRVRLVARWLSHMTIREIYYCHIFASVLRTVKTLPLTIPLYSKANLAMIKPHQVSSFRFHASFIYSLIIEQYVHISSVQRRLCTRFKTSYMFIMPTLNFSLCLNKLIMSFLSFVPFCL